MSDWVYIIFIFASLLISFVLGFAEFIEYKIQKTKYVTKSISNI